MAWVYFWHGGWSCIDIFRYVGILQLLRKKGKIVSGQRSVANGTDMSVGFAFLTVKDGRRECIIYSRAGINSSGMTQITGYRRVVHATTGLSRTVMWLRTFVAKCSVMKVCGKN